MITLHTKDQGILGESQVLAKFISLGIPVSIPFGDNTSYDLIAEFNGKLNKIQVKSSVQTSEGKTVFELKKKRINTTQSYSKSYDSDERKEIELHHYNETVNEPTNKRFTFNCGCICFRFQPGFGPEISQIWDMFAESNYYEAGSCRYILCVYQRDYKLAAG